MEHSFNVELAKEYGLAEAVFIKNMQYWIIHNKANKRHFHKGRTWTYNSNSAYTELFPYLKTHKIRAIIKRLIDNGVIMKDNFNENSYDRTLWYAFKDEKRFLGFSQIHLSNNSNGFDKEVNSTYTNIKPDIKPNVNSENEIFDSSLEYQFEENFRQKEKDLSLKVDSQEKEKVPQKRKASFTHETKTCSFIHSKFYNYEDFEKQMTEQKKLGIDVYYYYQSISDWSASSGKKKKDWIATARNFMRSDKDSNKLVMIKTGEELTESERNQIDFLNLLS